MGLGKTAVALAVCLAHPVGCTLVVVPVALIAQNWAAKIALNISGRPKVAIFASVLLLRHASKFDTSSFDYVIVVHSCLSADANVWGKVCGICIERK